MNPKILFVLLYAATHGEFIVNDEQNEREAVCVQLIQEATVFYECLTEQMTKTPDNWEPGGFF